MSSKKCRFYMDETKNYIKGTSENFNICLKAGRFEMKKNVSFRLIRRGGLEGEIPCSIRSSKLYKGVSHRFNLAYAAGGAGFE